MIRFSVSQEKATELLKRMESLEIHEADICEKFIRSSGSGGQKVNKTSSCVYLKHSPSGIEVKCQKDRSQTMNRFFARRELCDKFEMLKNGGSKNTASKAVKIRKQKIKAKKRASQKYNPTPT